MQNHHHDGLRGLKRRHFEQIPVAGVSDVVTEKLFVDSRSRDYSLHPNSQSFTVPLPRKMHDLESIRVGSVVVPRRMPTIGPHNDTLYFSEAQDEVVIVDQERTAYQALYVCRLPHGNYQASNSTGTTLPELLNAAMKAAMLHPAYAGGDAPVNPVNTYTWAYNTERQTLSVKTNRLVHYKVHCLPTLPLFDVGSVAVLSAGDHTYTLGLHVPGARRRHNLGSGGVLDLSFWAVDTATGAKSLASQYPAVKVDVHLATGVDADPSSTLVVVRLDAAFTARYAGLEVQGTCRPVVAASNIAPFLGFDDTVYLSRAVLAGATRWTGYRNPVLQTTANAATANTYILANSFGPGVEAGVGGVRVVVNHATLASAVQVTIQEDPWEVASTSGHADQSGLASVIDTTTSYMEIPGRIVGNRSINLNRANTVYLEVRLNARGESVGNLQVLDPVTRSYHNFLVSVPLDGDEGQVVFLTGPQDGLPEAFCNLSGNVASRVSEMSFALYTCYDGHNLAEYDLSGLDWSCTLEYKHRF